MLECNRYFCAAIGWLVASGNARLFTLAGYGDIRLRG